MIKQAKSIITNFLCILAAKYNNNSQSKDDFIIEVNYMVTVEEIRTRIQKAGWHLSERPVRNGSEISSWKLIAQKGERSFTVESTTLLLVMQNMGRLLGVWKP